MTTRARGLSVRIGSTRRARTVAALLAIACIVLARANPVAANDVVGAWSPVEPWPIIPIHVALLPDGRVLSYGNQSGAVYDVWNPADGFEGGHLTLTNPTGSGLFCGSQVVLPGGGVFIAGGGSEESPLIASKVFDYGGNALARTSDLNRPRYYSTSTTLLNGNTYIQGGTGGADRPEVRDADGGFHLLDGADTLALHWAYPRNFIAPDGRIFGYESNGLMYYVNTSGTGAVSRVGALTGPIGRDSSAAMFRPGRILQFGGRANVAVVVDITAGTPAVTGTESPASWRRHTNATILADGTVLATGGSEIRNELTNVAYSADIWNPTTGRWNHGASEVRARLYHSTALLLPDASVLVGGGGNPGPEFNDNVEIYYPPYLFDGTELASRPSIDSAPTSITVGQSFAVDVLGSPAVSRVVLVKTGSVTHSFNMEQRFVELTFQTNGNRLTVQAPSRAADAPPGFYLLFVIDQAGTPSVGRIANIGIAGAPNGAVTPNLVQPGNQTAQRNIELTFQLLATDPNDDPLSYSVTGLPPGLALDSATGQISGTPTSIGSFNVVATASDGTHSDSENFVWTISNSGSTFALLPPETPPPVLAGDQITLEAAATGGTDVTYKWDFDDGTPETEFSASPAIDHVFTQPGIHYVTVTAIDTGGIAQVSTVVVTVHLPVTPNRPAISGNLAVEARATGSDRLWVVNQDNDSVSVFDTGTNARVAEINVGVAPRSVAVLASGQVWVTNKQTATISVIDSATLAITSTIVLPVGSQPFGIAVAPSGEAVYVVLEGLGQLLQIDPNSGTTLSGIDVGPNPRQVSVSSDGSRAYISRFITRPLPGESTANVQTEIAGTPVGAEIVVVETASMTLRPKITLRHSDKPDFDIQGRGVPNYLGAVAIAPDGQSAWVPSKQDNVLRGVRRDTLGLSFENTIRAISSRVDLTANAEDYAARIDHDNSGIASACAYDRLGVYMFVALEATREVAIVDAYGGWEIFRISVGRAPQGLATSMDGRTLYVNNFMDRTVSIFDITALVERGVADVPLVATKATITTEKLTSKVLKGKRHFYDAKDPRLALDGYISCASCHNDGGHDGRVWDMTGFGEGLRNTVSLRGRAGAQGFLHWSNNFDEVQDFEGQIRNLAGGSGLMTNAQFNTGTRSQPLGDKKAGVSVDLDALAGYVASLNAFAPSPHRNADGMLTAAGAAGRAIFISQNCAACHGGTAFSNSASNNPRDVGTLTADSGKRLNGPLTGIDIPTLRDVWATAPYLHLGSAATIADAIRAHAGLALNETELAQLAAYVSQIGNQEASAPVPAGTGLAGVYFNNLTLTGPPVLARTEAVIFSWSTRSPGTGVNADKFSIRWTGTVRVPSTGNTRFQTAVNDGARLWVNGVQVVDNWSDHSEITTSSTVAIQLTAGVRYTITMEFYDNTGAAVAKLKWKTPGQTTYVPIPAANLYPN